MTIDLEALKAKVAASQYNSDECTCADSYGPVPPYCAHCAAVGDANQALYGDETLVPMLIAEIERMRPAFEAACEYRLKADEMRAAPINTGEVFDLGPLYEARSALFAAVDAARAKESK